MPAFGIIGLVAAIASVAALTEAANKFFRKDDGGHEPRPSTNSSSRSSGPTGPPHQSSPSSYTRGSYARDQTADRPHVTSDYGRSFHDSKHTSPHAGASARTQASYQPPSAPSRSQTTVKPTATAAHDHGCYDPGLTPSPAAQSRQPASTPAHAQAFYQPSSVPSHSQTTVTPTASAAHNRSLYGSGLTPSPAVQSRQPAPAPAYAQASYQRSPSPDPAHIPKSYQSSPTEPRSPYSSPAHLQVVDGGWHVLVQPSPVPEDLSDSESDEMEYIEDDDIAKKLRDGARHHRGKMLDALALAKSARRRGDSEVEDEHKKVAIARKNAMEQLNAKAAKIIFHQKNKGHKQGTIDLHGLYVEEAIQYAKQELQSASLRDDEVVRFIVGKGLHAQDGRAKIRPALEKLCTRRGLIHSLDPRNAGVLIVQLDTDPF